MERQIKRNIEEQKYYVFAKPCIICKETVFAKVLHVSTVDDTVDIIKVTEYGFKALTPAHLPVEMFLADYIPMDSLLITI